MKEVKAFDIHNNEIKRGNLVRIVKESEVKHGWLRVGNVLRVSSWQDRSLGKTPYICVFLQSKKGYNQCRMGIQDVSLEIVPEP